MSKYLAPLMTAIKANVPTVVIGEPGIGKTAMIENVITPQLGMRCETFITSIHDITDIGGLPVLTHDGVTLMPPALVKRIFETDTPTLVFFDELSTAPPSCQAGVLRIINERWWGEKKLPASTRFVAGMNPVHTSAGGGELTAPLANRLCHLQWGVDIDAWIRWAASQSQSHISIAGFIRSKATALLQVPKEESKLGSPWPSPRSWDMAGKLLETHKELNGSADDEVMLIGGCVGEGMGLEFINWRKKIDLPDPEMLLAKPDSFIVPERGDVAFTVLASVAHAAINKLNKQRYMSAWQIFHAAAEGGRKDIAASVILDLLKNALGKAGFMQDNDITAMHKKYLPPFTSLLRKAGIQVAS